MFIPKEIQHDFPTNNYHPQQCCEGYVFTGVCLSIGGEYLTSTPPGSRHPPWDQVHPLGPGTPLGLGTQPPRPGTPPRTRYTPWDQVHPPGPGTHPPGPGTHPQDMATAADGMHPTGMHSCFGLIFSPFLRLNRLQTICTEILLSNTNISPNFSAFCMPQVPFAFELSLNNLETKQSTNYHSAIQTQTQTEPEVFRKYEFQWRAKFHVNNP